MFKNLKQGDYYMENIKNLVEKLEEEFDEKKQIEILQDIGAMLINNYVIKVGDLTIEPMLVEAYYHHKGKFEDKSVYSAKNEETKAILYARSRQQKNKGKLFIHYNDWGIDVCLTDKSNYYLSYLIKNALVNGKWQTQSQIGKSVCQKCNKYENCKSVLECQYNDTVVLQSRPQQNNRIIYIPRVNIKNKDLLAALSVNEFLNGKYDFTLPTGCGKQWEFSIRALFETVDEGRAKQKAEKKFGEKIEEQYWQLAKNAFRRS